MNGWFSMLDRLITIITTWYRSFTTNGQTDDSTSSNQGTRETDADRRESDPSAGPTDGSDSTDDDVQQDNGGESTPTGDESDTGDDETSEDPGEISISWPPPIEPVDEWPEPPDDPDAVIEVRLFWPADEPWIERACRQARQYVEYCLLDAYAGQGYGVDVQAHGDPIPAGVSSYSGFREWADGLDDDAKDADVAVVSYGPEFGVGGGGGAWVNAGYFEDWNREPEAPIKRVGGDGGFDGPTAGVVTLLHEIGHCLGLGHLPDGENWEIEAYGNEYTPPMAAGYENTDRTRYIYEYHPELKRQPPSVQ